MRRKNEERRQKFYLKKCHNCFNRRRAYKFNMQLLTAFNKIKFKKIFIRRAIVFIMMPIVLAIDIDSYLLFRVGLIEYTTGCVGFLGILNGLLGTVIAFYFKGRSNEVEAD